MRVQEMDPTTCMTTAHLRRAGEGNYLGRARNTRRDGHHQPPFIVQYFALEKGKIYRPPTSTAFRAAGHEYFNTQMSPPRGLVGFL